MHIQLPENQKFNLYGVGYTGNTNKDIKYYGAFPPEQLPYVMQGAWGLVWDGTSSNTCEGVFGEYLRINNPHKNIFISCIWNSDNNMEKCCISGVCKRK